MLEVVTSWFTPTVLFCLMNLMIGTIFLSNKKPALDSGPAQPLDRAPSLLQRVRSINFYRNNDDASHDPFRPSPSERPGSDDPTHDQDKSQSLIERVRVINFNCDNDPTQAPSILQRVRSIKLSPFTTEQPNTTRPENPDPVRPEQHNYSSLHRSESEPTKAITRKSNPVSAPPRMRKSASEKMVAAAVVVESLELRRPATVREKKTGEDEEVDEKADNFINKFKQQLKLQRLDSILRYKEMLNRGA